MPYWTKLILTPAIEWGLSLFGTRTASAAPKASPIMIFSVRRTRSMVMNIKTPNICTQSLIFCKIAQSESTYVAIICMYQLHNGRFMMQVLTTDTYIILLDLIRGWVVHNIVNTEHLHDNCPITEREPKGYGPRLYLGKDQVCWWASCWDSKERHWYVEQKCSQYDQIVQPGSTNLQNPACTHIDD